MAFQQLAQVGDGSAFHGKTIPHQLLDQQVNDEESSMHPGALVSKEPVLDGSIHRSAMPEDIEGLRSAIIPSEAITLDDDLLEYEENVGVSLILGSAVPLPLQQLLVQYLPSRHKADRLTTAYFRSRGFSAPFIHASYLRRQDLWRDPLRTPISLWTSM